MPKIQFLLTAAAALVLGGIAVSANANAASEGRREEVESQSPCLAGEYKLSAQQYQEYLVLKARHERAIARSPIGHLSPEERERRIARLLGGMETSE